MILRSLFILVKFIVIQSILNYNYLIELVLVHPSHSHLSYINSSSSKSRRLTRVDVSKTTLVRYLDGLSYPSFYPICKGSAQAWFRAENTDSPRMQVQTISKPELDCSALRNHVNRISLVPFLALLWGGKSGWNDKHGRIKHAIKSGCKTV